MTTLLCSGGEHPAIVLQAVLLEPHRYGRVRVLTSAAPRLVPKYVQLAQDLADVCDCEVEHVPEMGELANQGEHDAFVEHLYRWYLRERARADGDIEVCLAGGFKSMVAALQKAAYLFGAQRLYHVLADGAPQEAGKPLPPSTRPEVELAIADGRVRLIQLGGELGWSAFAHLQGTEPSLREHVEGVLGRLRSSHGSFGEAPLPFTKLAWLSDDRLRWLRAPVEPEHDKVWLAALPKVELHCHLGGFASHGATLAEVRRAVAPTPVNGWPAEPIVPSGWPRPPRPVSLAAYQALGDATGSKLLDHPAALRAQLCALYRHLQEEHVAYAEIRCSPANYARGRSPWEVLHDIRHTLADARLAAQAAGQWAPEVHLILIGTRTQDRDLAPMAQSIALAIAAQGTAPEACRVVGLDLAGTEDITTRPREYESMFEAVHRCNLAVTVHAGENDGAESIYQAIHRLQARRLGHALRLPEAPLLLRTVADRQIAVELCPYANVQIVGFAPVTLGSGREYPLRTFLDNGVRVTVNTDNIGISGASLSDNLALAAELCPGVTRLDVVRWQKQAIEAAFVFAPDRQALLQRYEDALWQTLCAPTPAP